MEDKQILCVGLVVLDIINVVDKYPEEDTDSSPPGPPPGFSCLPDEQAQVGTQFFPGISAPPLLGSPGSTGIWGPSGATTWNLARPLSYGLASQSPGQEEPSRKHPHAQQSISAHEVGYQCDFEGFPQSKIVYPFFETSSKPGPDYFPFTTTQYMAVVLESGRLGSDGSFVTNYWCDPESVKSHEAPRSNLHENFSKAHSSKNVCPFTN
ncbi:ketohexokinase [Leptonychotes weddellii]|uniref:Ketohexokinase n=1 Tax=Leptonychotes weddellii TaxID=9713 RepID=A0A7F8RPF8_LEPWE|nr:ketohexokinase [Leptonychotes weddellii]